MKKLLFVITMLFASTAFAAEKKKSVLIKSKKMELPNKFVSKSKFIRNLK